MTDSDLLRRIGEALYGSRWQSELARAIAVSDRELRRWLAGTVPMPGGVWTDLESLVGIRGRALGDAAEALDRKLAARKSEPKKT